MEVARALIVGLGVTGLSVARYLAKNNIEFDIVDQKPALDEALIAKEPAIAGVRYIGDGWSAELLCGYSHLIVSPGISVRTAAFEQARAQGVEVIGDVELFARDVTRPILAVTGSNGKSTVVSMAGELLRASGLRAAVIGNVGVACLDGLADDEVDVYVLELSSFQLETTVSLQPLSACVLNVTEDHLDRYDGMDDYAAVKRSIYHGAAQIVCNADDSMTHPVTKAPAVNFSMQGTASDWFVDQQTLCGPGVRVSVNALQVSGGHNRANALAAMALVSGMLDTTATDYSEVFAAGLSAFTGLPHRAELVCVHNEVRWFNDSKGTNVGACVSAIEGMDSPVVLIAGGRGKKADYTPMKSVVGRQCRAVILIGEEATNIAATLDNIVPVYFEESMHGAVQQARLLAIAGDCVLLSPACSSFDMFENFEVRGAVFSDEVRKLCA